MQPARAPRPQLSPDAAEVVQHYLAATYGDPMAALELLATNAIAEVRSYELAIRRHVSHGYVRAAPVVAR